MRSLLLITAALTLVGCVVAKEWVATGGSRADGVVKLSYEVGNFEKPQLNEQQGNEIAVSRCAAWGYPGAEAFGGYTTICSRRTQGGCAYWRVTRAYQCFGK